MASKRAVASAVAMLGRAFAGVVDEARIDIYAAALEDMSDADLMTATTRVIKTHTGEFIPPPAVIRRAVMVASPVVDADTVVRKIAALAVYNPNTGMVYPRVDAVRTALGDEAAYAYAAAGGIRLFSDNEISREIATREFQKAMTDAIVRPGADLPVIDGRPAIGRLGSGDPT